MLLLDASSEFSHPCYTLTHFRYEEAKVKGLDNYDRDLEDNIDRLIVECDRKIERALKRLDEDDARAAVAISVSEVTLVRFCYLSSPAELASIVVMI